MEASALPRPAGIARPAPPPVLLRVRSDPQLLALFRAGSEEAFDAIHDRYRARLLAYMRQMLRGDAEDALQDVFLRAYAALRADDRPIALRAWLYRVAHNRCIDELRRPAPTPAELVEREGPDAYDPFTAAERREALQRLVGDLRRLPEQQRSALLMRELEGLTYDELSSALDVTLPAVKSLLVRARMGLAESDEARNADCTDIRAALAGAKERGVRASGHARRHLRDCPECTAYRTALHGTARSLGALSPGHGLPATLAKLLGGGATAGGGALAGGGGAAGIAGGGVVTATAAKAVVVVCCVAATAGGAASLEHRVHARRRAARAHPGRRRTRRGDRRGADPRGGHDPGGRARGRAPGRRHAASRRARRRPRAGGR